MIISLKVSRKYSYQCKSFFSFTDANETREMHAKSDNITIMSGIETEMLLMNFLTFV